MTFGWHSVTTLLVLTFAGRVTSLPVLILGQILFLAASLYHAHVPLSTRLGRWARSLCFVYSRIFSVQFFLSFFVLLSVLLPLGYVKYFLNQSLLRRLTSAAGVDFRKRPIDDTEHTCEWVWTRVGSDLENVNQENFQNVTGNTFLCSLMAK